MEGSDNARKALEATVTCVNRMLFQLGDASHTLPKNSRKRSHAALKDTNQEIVQKQAPPGLEAPFQELYDALRPCLLDRQPNTNVAALVMGMRGIGKTMMVERCLDCLNQEQQPDQRAFRVLRLNGILLRGNDVTYVVHEIVKQLSEVAMNETSTSKDKDLRKLLRLRLNSSFTSNLSLLDDVLKLACVDGIPVLIVLDELDRLLGSTTASVEFSSRATAATEAASSERQLLLYHLLDRVTTQGSSLCLIAMTSHLSTLGLLEKRVRSRAEGASKVMYVKPFTTYEGVIRVLLQNLSLVKCAQDPTDCESHMTQAWTKLYQDLSRMLKPNGNTHGEMPLNLFVLERNFRLGKDLRWFGRVLSCALSLYHGDCQLKLLADPFDEIDAIPTLQEEHLLSALAANGASMAHFETQTGDDVGPATLGGYVGGAAVDPRMQTLLDLSGPQVALILATRRILARDNLHETNVKPLTLERIMDEYQTSYKGSTDKYSPRILRDAFGQLLELNLLRPSADHSGSGPLQYEHQQAYKDMYALSLSRSPLHFPVEIERELGEAIKTGMLDCSTALREWGKRKNN